MWRNSLCAKLLLNRVRCVVKTLVLVQNKLSHVRNVETFPVRVKKRSLIVNLSDGRTRQIQHIKTDFFWDADGKPISAQDFLEKMFGQLPDFFSDEDELRKTWSDPYTRKEVLN